MSKFLASAVGLAATCALSFAPIVQAANFGQGHGHPTPPPVNLPASDGTLVPYQCTTNGGNATYFTGFVSAPNQATGRRAHFHPTRSLFLNCRIDDSIDGQGTVDDGGIWAGMAGTTFQSFSMDYQTNATELDIIFFGSNSNNGNLPPHYMPVSSKLAHTVSIGNGYSRVTLTPNDGDDNALAQFAKIQQVVIAMYNNDSSVSPNPTTATFGNLTLNGTVTPIPVTGGQTSGCFVHP